MKSLVTEPVTDQSSGAPTPADVRRVKAAANPPRRRKTVKKARPATTVRKTRKTSVKRRKTARK